MAQKIQEMLGHPLGKATQALCQHCLCAQSAYKGSAESENKKAKTGIFNLDQAIAFM